MAGWVAVFSSDSRSGWIDQAFRYVDTTPPTVTPVISSGTLGDNGWYISDVSLYFFVNDPDSPITSAVGCEFITLSTDTTGTTFTCTVTSEGGSASGSITVKRDATPPGGIIRVPASEFLYKRYAFVNADYVCGDATSGIATCMAQSPNGQPLQTNVPGHYKFDVWADDRAGNVGIITRYYDVGSGQCEQRPYGLVGWWPGDGHYRDIVGGHDGTIVNGAPNFYSSPYSMGMALTSSAFLQIADTDALLMQNAFTLSAWVYFVRDWLNPVSVIAGREGEYLLARGPDGNLHYSIANTDPGWGWVNTGVRLYREQWTKVALTYDGSSIRLYKNGKLAYSAAASGEIGDAAPGENEFRIAARQNASEPSYFDGGIDDVEVVNRAMSAVEIDSAYLTADFGLCALTTVLALTPAPQRATHGSPAELVAPLTNFTGQPIAGEQVHFTFRGLFAGSAVTDATGQARVAVSIEGLSAATYANAVQAAHPATAYLKYLSANADFVIDKAASVVTWNAPAAITFGTALSGLQLDATANVGGTFTYSPASGAVLSAGSHALGVMFTPFSSNYSGALASVPPTEHKAMPIVNVVGGSFTYDGAAHPATGTATGVGGANLGPLTFTYNGSSEQPVNAGSHAVVGSYAGDADYDAASGSATITIGKATPTLTVNGGTFTYDATAHAATGSVTGMGGAGLGPITFTYNGAAEPPINAATYDVVATYAGDANYAAASGSTTITIGKATPALSWTRPATIVYGTALGTSQLNANADVAGSFSYMPAAGTVLSAGNGQALSASFTPADAANYAAGSPPRWSFVQTMPRNRAVPGGRVLFMVDGAVVGNPAGEILTTVSGSIAHATLDVSGLAHGRHTVTATYLGDPTYRGSTGTVIETVE